MANIELFMSIV